ALLVETTIFLSLAYKPFDLTNTGEIVVQKRIHGRSGAAMQPVSPMRRERIPKRAPGPERHGGERAQRQFCDEVTQPGHHLHDLQYRDGAFLDAINQNALD